MEPVTRWVPSSGGVEVAVHDFGGSGPPLLFCHATGFHGRMWEPVIERLVDVYWCLALDFRAHGDSRYLGGGGRVHGAAGGGGRVHGAAGGGGRVDVEWSGMADDVLAVIDAEELGPLIHAVGHSMGGCALVLAEQRRPGTLGAAWLVEPVIMARSHGPATGGNFLAEGARRRREVFASRDEAFERYSSRPPFDACDPVALRAYVDHGFRDQPDGTVILKCRAEDEARTFENSLPGAFEALDTVSTPIVVVVGGDGSPPAQAAPLVAEALPHGRLVEWPDLSHFAPLEDPARLATLIRSRSA